MMFKLSQTALFFIAIGALSTWATAQNVYRCGDSYSQSPCAGGVAITVDDARDAAQKNQADEAARRDAKLAQTLEKDRLAQEKVALTQRGAAGDNTKNTQGSKKTKLISEAASAPQAPEIVHKITPKRPKSAAKKPVWFEAQVPGSAQTASVKTKKKKKKKAQTS